MVKMVYFGLKRPKVLKVVSSQFYSSLVEEGKRKGDGITYLMIDGKNLTYKFEPFQQIDVDNEVAKILLDKANDLFKRVDVEEGKPNPKPIVKADGYVGDATAESIKDLKKRVENDNKDEEGKNIEQIIEEESSRNKAKKSKEAK